MSEKRRRGRPKRVGGQIPRRSIRVSNEDWEDWAKQAKKWGLSRSAWIRKAANWALWRMEPGAGEKAQKKRKGG